MDVLWCDESPLVIEDLSIAKKDLSNYFLLILRESNTPAGYVKLQLVKKGVPVTLPTWTDCIDLKRCKCDQFQRLLMIDTYDIEGSSEDKKYVRQKNKPAATYGIGMYHCDNVMCYRCRTWPTFAKDWISRDRLFGWPTKDMIEELRLLGFFVVKKGHPFSPEVNLEWRISFSLQERKLMCNLTDIQHKCYIVLKMINREIINLECITSYHWKTCLFYVIEENNMDIWTKKRLYYCVNVCIKHMLSWVEKKFCPNYFIPEENLFDGRMNTNLKKMMSESRLLKLLIHRFESMYLIKTSNMCDYVASRGSVETFQHLQSYSKNEYKKAVNVVYENMNSVVLRVFNLQIESCYKKANGNMYHFIKSVWKKLHSIQQIDTITEHTPEETKHALLLLLPHIYSCLASNIASMAIQHPNPKVRDFLLLGTFEYFMKGGLIGQLKFISVLYAIGLYQDCEWFLNHLDDDYVKYNPSVCGCIYKDNKLYQKVPDNLNDNIELHASTCISFLRTEESITPYALKFEMFSCFGISLPHNKSNNKLCQWYNRAIVDSNIYFFLLKFLIARRLEKSQMEPLFIFLNFVNDSRNINHEDVAWNLLAWCYTSIGISSIALKCLRRSTVLFNSIQLYSMEFIEDKIRKQHQITSAKLHFVVILYKIWFGREQQDNQFCFECLSCYSKELKTCSRCKIANFCSIQCREKNLKIHNDVCELVRRYHDG